MLGAAVLVAVGVVGVAVGLGDRMAVPIGAGPAPTASATGPGGCALPPFRPGYLPWLDDGQKVGDPVHAEAGDPDGADARMVWARDADADDPDGPIGTDHVVLQTLAELDDVNGPAAAVRVRGATGLMRWVGDPGVGTLSVIWREQPGRCGAHAIHLTIRGIPGYLELHRPSGDEPVDEQMLGLERALEGELRRIADSLEEPDPRGPAG